MDAKQEKKLAFKVQTCLCIKFWWLDSWHQKYIKFSQNMFLEVWRFSDDSKLSCAKIYLYLVTYLQQKHY